MNQTDSSEESIKKTNSTPQLYVHEWLAVVAIVGFLLLLTLIVIFRGSGSHILDEKKDARLHYLKPQTVNVYIDGAVAKPGSYAVKAGTLIKDVVAMAEPLPEADLRKIRPAVKARNGQSCTVATRPAITIYISGAVQAEGLHTIPKGTRLCEISNHIALKPTADLDKMNRKRYLKDNEKIFVPEK